MDAPPEANPACLIGKKKASIFFEDPQEDLSGHVSINLLDV
jgi:hypothetical protein